MRRRTEIWLGTNGSQPGLSAIASHQHDLLDSVVNEGKHQNINFANPVMNLYVQVKLKWPNYF